VYSIAIVMFNGYKLLEHDRNHRPYNSQGTPTLFGYSVYHFYRAKYDNNHLYVSNMLITILLNRK
jgi:hypothetical protein